MSVKTLVRLRRSLASRPEHCGRLSGVSHPFVWYLNQIRALLPDMTMFEADMTTAARWAGPTATAAGTGPSDARGAGAAT
jgi:hypothetical protein